MTPPPTHCIYTVLSDLFTKYSAWKGEGNLPMEKLGYAPWQVIQVNMINDKSLVCTLDIM